VHSVGLHDQWYQNSIIYCLDVETFADSNGDGVGDFIGLTRRLDYLAGLGVTTLWLMPFYPTPNRDDGYDVSDYNAIDPRLGTMADFTEFVIEAEERGLHVIIDLVPNHSSDRHPWFQKARLSPDSPYRDYYVWREDDPGDTSDQVVFPGEQEGIWTWDEEAKAYYLHHFYSWQPDLNYSNPAVREEFRRTMGLWLRLGVKGFRIDAASFLINRTGQEETANLGPAHEHLQEMKDFATVRTGNAILLGEVDVGLSTLADYFGGGNQLQALFNFPLNRYLFLGLGQQSADPISFGLQQLPTIPDSGQWVNFLRHHDELNLSRLTKDQREQVFAAFGSEPRMQIYDRGLRRRLATMFEGDAKRLRMAYSLMFGLPGSPMLFYGEEIGMGEHLGLDGRLAVRTPMPWNGGPNAGFSSGDPKDLVRPLVDDETFGYESVNVAGERADPDSLLNWMATLIRARRECHEIGDGEWQVLDVDNDQVLAVRYDHEESSAVVFNNLSESRQTVKLDLSKDEIVSVTDLLSDRRYEPFDPDKRTMRIDGYGYRWMRLRGVY
jgi:maltose alpha-D-glucosyltransferase / alpha-amylase